MKRLLVVFVVCLIFAACGEEIEPLKSLQKGMPNTVTLSTGDVVYDINGEWDAIIDDGPWGKFEDILKITQEGNKFVGIILNGNVKWHKGDELIKGELVKNGFKPIKRNTTYHGWISGTTGEILRTTGKIDEGCNKMVVKTELGVENIILTLNRK